MTEGLIARGLPPTEATRLATVAAGSEAASERAVGSKDDDRGEVLGVDSDADPEWRDPTVAAWEEMAQASGSTHGGPSQTSPRVSAKLAATLHALDWSQLHRALIPNVWNRIKLNTFTETWAVIGLWPPSDPAIDPRRRVVLEAYGTGGLTHAMKHLRSDDVQYVALRVELPDGTARFIASAWLGPASPAWASDVHTQFGRKPQHVELDDDEGDGEGEGRTTEVIRTSGTGKNVGEGHGRGDEEDGELSDDCPEDAVPDATWRDEWAAVRHYLSGAHAYTAVDGRQFVPDGNGDEEFGPRGRAGAGTKGGREEKEVGVGVTAAGLGSSMLGGALGTCHVDFDNARTSAMPRATHYDYDAPGDDERAARGDAGEELDALGAALAAFNAENVTGERHTHGVTPEHRSVPEHVRREDGEGEETERDGGVQLSEAAMEATREALLQMRAELALAASALETAEWRASAAAAKVAHAEARRAIAAATEARRGEKSAALRERLAERRKKAAAEANSVDEKRV